MRRVRVVVSGRVQGVFYRQSCRDRAVALGLAGWVRNRGDGTVEAELEGDPASVDLMLAWMAEGPPAALVIDRQVTEATPTGETRFAIC